jgi:flavodoxin I
LAGAVRKGLQDCGKEVVVRNVRQTQPEELNEYSLLLIGCSTWEDGALQRDFMQFKQRLGTLRLDGKYAAIFGPGSRDYPHFCAAIDILEAELVARGATLIQPSLRVEGSGYAARPVATNWAKEIVAKL